MGTTIEVTTRVTYRSLMNKTKAELAHMVLHLMDLLPSIDDPMNNHKCRMIAKAIRMGDGREWWLGKLLEPIPGHPEETHCLHITTPYKSVVWGINAGDMEAYGVFAYIVHGYPLHSAWLESMAKAYQGAAGRESA